LFVKVTQSSPTAAAAKPKHSFHSKVPIEAKRIVVGKLIGNGNCLFYGLFADLKMNGVVNDSVQARRLLGCHSAQEVRLVIMDIIEENPGCTLGDDAIDAMSIEDSLKNEVRLCVFMHACIASITHIFIYAFIYISRSIRFLFFLFVINVFVALPLHNKILPNFSGFNSLTIYIYIHMFIYMYIYINTFLYIYIYTYVRLIS
jgi:hypothetical protein